DVAQRTARTSRCGRRWIVAHDRKASSVRSGPSEAAAASWFDRRGSDGVSTVNDVRSEREIQSRHPEKARFMKLTFRWYGPDDPVTLGQIRQIPIEGIVSALHHIPSGMPWPETDVAQLREIIEAAGLRLEAVESIPVH